MLISWQPVLGRGGSHEKSQPPLLRLAGMHSNLKLHPELTRFLCFAALKESYVEDFDVLPDAMRIMGDNLRAAFLDGVELKNGLRIRLCAFSVKGDMPWLIEAGGLTRHFRHAPKKGESQCKGVGICWLCLAGQENYPFTDVGLQPWFEATEGSAAAAEPWLTRSPFTETLAKDPESLEWIYRPDFWHNFHLGHGRYFLASVMVVLMPLFAGTSVAARFDHMTQCWRSYCTGRRRRPLLSKISMQAVNYGPLDWPEGGWQKAETTTLLCAPWYIYFDFWHFSLSIFSCNPYTSYGFFFNPKLSQEWLEQEMCQDHLWSQRHTEPRFMLLLLAVRSSNETFKALFANGAWLHKDDASFIAAQGLQSLRAYHQLATMSLEMREPRFPTHSKFHMLWHSWRSLEKHVSAGLEWQESPLVDSCQQDEGFIGHIARYSRRVAPRQTIQRTLDLYLASLYRHWRGLDAAEAWCAKTNALITLQSWILTIVLRLIVQFIFYIAYV